MKTTLLIKRWVEAPAGTVGMMVKRQGIADRIFERAVQGDRVAQQWCDERGRSYRRRDRFAEDLAELERRLV